MQQKRVIGKLCCLMSKHVDAHILMYIRKITGNKLTETF